MKKVFAKECSIVSAKQYDGKNGDYFLFILNDLGFKAVEIKGDLSAIVFDIPASKSSYSRAEHITANPLSWFVEFESGNIRVLSPEDFEKRYEILEIGDGKVLSSASIDMFRSLLATIQRQEQTIKKLKLDIVSSIE
jgi:hypothetical protein